MVKAALYNDCLHLQEDLHGVPLPWNNDRILVVLQLEGKGVLLGVMSGGNTNARLRLFNLLHELEVHVESFSVAD